MNLADLAALMGKNINEVESMLKNQDVVEVKLNEGRARTSSDSGTIKVLN